MYSFCKPSGEGSGLNLDIVKKIINKHHGDIRFDSETDKGTCFTVTCPMNTKAQTQDVYVERNHLLNQILIEGGETDRYMIPTVLSVHFDVFQNMIHTVDDDQFRFCCSCRRALLPQPN